MMRKAKFVNTKINETISLSDGVKIRILRFAV